MAKQQYQAPKTPAPTGTQESTEQTEQQQTTAEQTGETQQSPTSEELTQEQTGGTESEGSTEETDKPNETPVEQTEQTEQPPVIQTESTAEPVAPSEQPIAPVSETVIPAPVVEPTPVVEPQQPQTQLTESATERFASEPAQVSTLRQELQNYIGEMAPNRRMDPQEGAGHQTALARLIESTITEADSRVFIAKMSVWLETIREHRNGVFSERYVNRFADSIALSKSKLQSFQYLVHLFLTTADGTAVGSTIEMDTALRGVHPDFAARLRQYVERVTKR